MTFIKKTVSGLLILSILISSLFIQFSFNASALSSKGTVIADSLNIRPDANTSGTSKGKVTSGATVQINSKKKGQTITDDGKSSDIWYNITYNGITGWVSSIYIKEIPEYTHDQAFENHIADFPESYKPYLRDLHAQYPNWKFYPDNINMTFDEAVEYQIPANLDDKYKYYKVVHNTSPKSWLSMGYGAYFWNEKKWQPFDTDWYAASREVVRHYMDPRNYLNASVIYAFLPQVYDASTQTETGLSKIIKGTFLENRYSDANDTAYGGSYSKVIMEAARQSNVNPYVLAGTILQEQGSKGTSVMISGNYSAYPNCYNFFNVRTYGDSEAEKAQSGLNYALQKNWNTRSASIIGGALFCANGYLNAGQDTYYYMNFNMKQVGTNFPHQYATHIADTYGKSQKISKIYIDLKEAELDFKIPIYNDMPATASPRPVENDTRNNYYFDKISVNGLTPSFYRYTYKYDLRVTGDTIIDIAIPSTASLASNTEFPLKAGNNTVVLRVKSQSGYTNDYTIDVYATRNCTLFINKGNSNISGSNVAKGDIDGNGKITVSDMATIRLSLLGKYTLSGKALEAADIDGNGKVTVSDMATVRLHLLGKYIIK